MEDLFKIALGLQHPWLIDRIELTHEEDNKELHIYLRHERGAQFQINGKHYSVYDHQERVWRHLNFFEHRCYLHAKVPRVKTEKGQVLQVDVPWAKPGSSFTLLFEAYTALLIKGGMSVSKAGTYVGIHGKRVWTIIRNMTSSALSSQPLEEVEHLGVDETSSKKGHQYFTVLTDVKRRKVVGVGIGKDQSGFDDAMLDLEVRGADKNKVKVVTLDMSPAYIAAVDRHMPDAAIVFDRFHLEQGMNKVVDQVRRTEAKKYKQLKKSRYLWLRNNNSLGQKQRKDIDFLSQAYPTLGEVYRLKELFKQVLNDASISSKLKPINDWIKLAWKSKIDQVRAFVRTLHTHWYGIKTYFKFRVTNAYPERVNLKIQEIKRVAKGYRNPRNFILMIYFHLGELDLGLPT